MVQCPLIRSLVFCHSLLVGLLVVVHFSLSWAGCLKIYSKAPFHKGATLKELDNFLLWVFFFKWVLKTVYLAFLPSYLGNQIFISQPSLLFCVLVSSSERWRFRSDEWFSVVLWAQLLDHFRAGNEKGVEALRCCFYFKVTQLLSVLYWGFCVFTFELRTLKSTGLDDLCSFWF